MTAFVPQGGGNVLLATTRSLAFVFYFCYSSFGKLICINGFGKLIFNFNI